MAFFLLWLTVFIMFFQPVSIWPALAPYQPLRNVAFIALIAFFSTERKNSIRSFFSNPINRYFLLFVMTQIISSFVMGWSGSAVEVFNLWLRMGIVYFLITQLATDEHRIKSLMTAIVFGIVYLSYFSFYQYVQNYVPGMRVGAFGWYENPNDLAIILVSCIPLCLLLAESRKHIVKILFLCIAGMFAFNVLFTGSRNGLLGLVVSGGIGLALTRGFPRVIKGLLFILLIVAMLTIGLRGVLSRADLGGAISGDDSSEHRIEQWYAAARMLKDYPLLGVGPGEFTTFVVEYGGIKGLAPHNTLVQVFAETGIVGGSFFFLFSFYPFYLYRRWRKLHATYQYHPAVPFLLTAMFGFWVCAIFSNRYHFYILYVMTALFVAAQNSKIFFMEQEQIRS